MSLEDETARFDEQISENQRQQLRIMRWLIENPNAHPDETQAKNAMCEQLEEENERLQKLWDEARDRWLVQRIGTATRVRGPIEEIIRDAKRRVE